MQHVLSTTTSAASSDAAGTIPSAVSRPAMRSESCSFIWHPYVRTTKLRADSVTGAPGYGPPRARTIGPIASPRARHLGLLDRLPTPRSAPHPGRHRRVRPAPGVPVAAPRRRHGLVGQVAHVAQRAGADAGVDLRHGTGRHVEGPLRHVADLDRVVTHRMGGADGGELVPHPTGD